MVVCELEFGSPFVGIDGLYTVFQCMVPEHKNLPETLSLQVQIQRSRHNEYLLIA